MNLCRLRYFTGGDAGQPFFDANPIQTKQRNFMNQMIERDNAIDFPEEVRVVLNNIKTRWSCRIFKDSQVPREVIEILLEAANYAPSPKNCQPWEFISISGNPLRQFHRAIDGWLREKEHLDTNKEELKKILPEGDYYTTLPAELFEKQKLFLKNISEQVQKFGVQLKDVYQNTFYFHYAPAVILVIGDRVKRDRHGLEVHQALAAAVQNILLGAHALGYGSCWIGDILRFGKKLNSHFNLSEMKEVVAGIAIGLPGISIRDVAEQVKQAADKDEVNLSETELIIDRPPKQPVNGKAKFLGW
jgi:nitroreductase